MYDTPAEVAEAFLSSLTETIEGVDAEDGHSPGLMAERGGGAGVPSSLPLFSVSVGKSSTQKHSSIAKVWNSTAEGCCFPSLF